MKNRQKTVLRTWVVITLAAFGATFLPGAIGMDMMKGGYALVVLCGFVAVVGLVTMAFYRKRAAVMESLLKDEGLLLNWTIPADLWRRFIGADYAIDRKAMRGIFALIAVISLVVGGILIAAEPKGAPIFLAIIGGLIALLAVVMVLAPWVRHRRHEKAEPEVRLSANGVIVGGAFHNWNSAGSRLERVEVIHGEPKMLAIVYSFWTRQGRQEWTVRIPVPPGREEEAARAAVELKRLATAPSR